VVVGEEEESRRPRGKTTSSRSLRSSSEHCEFDV
jgi:hypothetical protein